MHVILIFIYYLDLVVNSLFLLCTIVSVQNEQNETTGTRYAYTIAYTLWAIQLLL